MADASYNYSSDAYNQGILSGQLSGPIAPNFSSISGAAVYVPPGGSAPNYSPVNGYYPNSSSNVLGASTQQPQQPQQASYNPNNYAGWDPVAAAADAKANPNKYANLLSDQQNQYNQQRDQAYNESNSYLDKAGGVAQSALEAAQQTAGSTYDLNASQLGNSQQTAFDTLNKQKTTGTTSYENALADARRMYQEQQQGAMQRFGGSSSAGQAASEIQAREQARQFGQTNRQYTDLVNNINTQHASVERDYQTGLMQLQQQKQASIQAATQDFNNKLLQISQNRAQLSQAKADASLQALQNLRNQVFSIEQQNTQFQQQLELQKQQAQLGLSKYAQSALGYTQQVSQPTYQQPSNTTSATGGLGQSTQNPYAGYTGSGGNTQALVYQGNIGTGQRRDQYGNVIYGTA